MVRALLRLGTAMLLFVPCVAGAAGPEPAGDYLAQVLRWRAERLERLRAEDGWLTLVGLHWLEAGENRFGANPDLPIVLSAAGVPAWAGTFHLAGASVQVEAAPGSPLIMNGEPVTGRKAVSDDSGTAPDVLGLGRLRLLLLKRGERFAVRVKDKENPLRTAFGGIEHFDVDPAYRLDAIFKPFDAPLPLRIATAAGSVEELLAPGQVEFVVNGQKRTLLPLIEKPGETKLWFIFKDLTSGKETYGFRYLYADLAEGGKVALDFNYAYNPPCAFTPYATCALPPKENMLETRIAAGEKMRPH